MQHMGTQNYMIQDGPLTQTVFTYYYVFTGVGNIFGKQKDQTIKTRKTYQELPCVMGSRPIESKHWWPQVESPMYSMAGLKDGDEVIGAFGQFPGI